VCLADVTTQGRTDSESDWTKLTFVWKINLLLLTINQRQIFISSWFPDNFRIYRFSRG
jgi:hypothetical protein